MSFKTVVEQYVNTIIIWVPNIYVGIMSYHK